jgi:hypothetical protein
MPKWYRRYFLTNDGLHGGSVLGGCVVGVELVANGGVILSVLLNGLLHETRKRGEHVDGRIDLLVVELSVDEDLSLGDVACEIGDGVSDVVVLGNGKDTGMDRMGI